MIQSINILFWNINRKPLEYQIRNLIRLHQINVLILAECEIISNELLHFLNEDQAVHFRHVACNKCTKIQFFSTLSFNLGKEIKRAAEFKLKIKEKNISIIGMHLLGRVNTSEYLQLGNMVDIASFIKQLEEDNNHKRTIGIGDLNHNPFDKAIVLPQLLNAVMTQDIAKEILRTVQAVKCYYFYNPCWSLLGDLSKGVSGTHFYKNEYQWQMYDQVLIRPELLDNFVSDSLEILVTDGAVNFLTSKGKINIHLTSDHLPLKCTFKF